MKRVEDSNKMAEDKEDVLLLFTDLHPFRSDMYLSVTDDVPEAKNTTISGTFIAKVFDGAYKDIPIFFKEMVSYLNKQDKKSGKPSKWNTLRALRIVLHFKIYY